MHARRFAALTLSLAAIGTTAAPAVATTSPHWTKSRCSSYAKKYKKASKSKKSAANKSLKLHGCKITVK